jgi:acetate kinase
MRKIVAAMEAGNHRAGRAFEMFVHHLQSAIGAMIAVLGGIDVLIFTAGIGENSPEVRGAVCANFEFLGLKLDGAKKCPVPRGQEISFSDSALRVLVIPAQEDWAIACDCWRLASVSRSSLFPEVRTVASRGISAGSN